MKKLFWLVYLILVICDLLVASSDFDQYRILTKPALLISLLVYFAGTGRYLAKKVYGLMLCALVFSLLGDIFLLFDSRSDSYFVLGLVSFLLAHLTYGTVFMKARNKNPPPYIYGIAMMLIAVGMSLFFYIKDGLDALTYPVIVYILGILFMAISALLRIKKVHANSFLWVSLGAFFFVVSDSILAIDMFRANVPWSTIWIMGSYATAQYLIVEGILRQKPDF